MKTAIAFDDQYICQSCGFDRRVLLELIQSESRASRTVAWTVVHNCSECKKAMVEFGQNAKWGEGQLSQKEDKDDKES